MNKKFTDKPGWDDYFMTMAFLVAMRSPDPDTKHGCVFVDQKNRILTLGYNGAPRGCRDDLIPWDKRPDKYYFSTHSEENAFANANGSNLEGSTIYVTGFPCHRCFAQLLQYGVAKIVYGKQGSYFGRQNEYSQGDCDSEWAVQLMLKGHEDLSIVAYEGNPLELFASCMLYYANRIEGDHALEQNLHEFRVGLTPTAGWSGPDPTNESTTNG